MTKRMFVVALALVAVAAIAAPVSATPPTEVNGTYALVPGPRQSSFSGGRQEKTANSKLA